MAFGPDNACALPEQWADSAVFTVTDPSSDDGGPVTRIVVAALGPRDLTTAVAAVPEPRELDDLTVLFAQYREVDGVPFFERVVRFADPTSEAPIQQSVRIMAVDGAAYALLYSAAAWRFNDGYATFSQFVHTFVGRVRGAP